MLWLLFHNWRATRADQPAVQRAPDLVSLAAAALLPVWWLRPAFAPRPGGDAPTQTEQVARRLEEAAAMAREAAEMQAAAERLERDLSVLSRRRHSGSLAASLLSSVPFFEAEEKAEVEKLPSKRATTDALTDPTLLLEPYLGWVQARTHHATPCMCACMWCACACACARESMRVCVRIRGCVLGCVHPCMLTVRR